MTPQEIKNEIDAIASELGKKAYVSLHIGSGPVWNNDGALSLTAYPQGIGSDKHRISVNAHAFEDAILLLRASIGESVAKINADTIRKLAIAIMTLTADAGECSDAGLRAQGFAQSEIDQHGKAACEEATRIGSGGPFEIVRLSGANSNGGPLVEAIPQAAE